ncbi:hypothetical protein AKJ08_1164 [Vulgatibacter incomptus]|uniref:Uncharacterized protein n=1 Tax=Vulgatibacter incomptus TaxID=1391653 RepID=A0A0K1PBB0_9BACT|nr:hypothetical protein AKJ08_1164 [Vulgatibacter incomptus]
MFPLLVEAAGLSLHYGWFSEGRSGATSVEALRNGQRRFVDEVVELVPREAGTLLDVGTGTGDVAAALAGRGHVVTSISPDPDQARWARRHLGPALELVPVRFEDFPLGRRFDCVLFSESSNYVDLDNLLVRSDELLAVGGSLVLAAPFLRERSDVFTDLHSLDEFRRRAERASWEIECERDATAEVAPTLELGRRLAGGFAGAITPAVSRVIDWAAGGGYARLLRMLDADRFRSECVFLFVRLRRRRP